MFWAYGILQLRKMVTLTLSAAQIVAGLIPEVPNSYHKNNPRKSLLHSYIRLRPSERKRTDIIYGKGLITCYGKWGVWQCVAEMPELCLLAVLERLLCPKRWWFSAEYDWGGVKDEAIVKKFIRKKVPH